MENYIHIGRPIIENLPDVDRITCIIDESGKEYTLYAEVEKEYGQYLCTERSDAYLCLVLPIALREGYDIYCDMPVTERLLHNFQEILIPHLCLGDSRLKEITIHADTDNVPIGGGGVGTGISCGVDSLYTVKEYSVDTYPNMKLTHLFIAPANKELWNNLDQDVTLRQWVDSHEAQFDRMKIVSDALGVPLLKMYNNYVWYICKTGRGQKLYKHVYLHTFLTISMVLTLKKLWNIYYFSSASPFTTFTLEDNATLQTGRYDLLTMHALTTPDFFIYSGGVKANRIRKTIELLDFDLAKQVLHPCDTRDSQNCSEPTCAKCLRALLTYDAYDRLDEVTELFDVERYRREKDKYFTRLVIRKKNPYMKDLYAMLSEKYPEQMVRVESEVEQEKRSKAAAKVNEKRKSARMKPLLARVKRKLVE